MNNPIDDLEFEDISFDDYEKEISDIDSHLNELYEWHELMSSVEESLCSFISNMNSLALPFELLHKENKGNRFLIGVLWSGILSAYEGFIHNLVYSLLQKESFQAQAVARVGVLSEADKKYFGIRSNIKTKKHLESVFSRATLNNPNKASALLKVFFDIDIPRINEKDVEKAMQIRNAYAHSNGRFEGSEIAIGVSALKKFHEKVDFIIAFKANKLTELANKFL